MTDKLGLTGTDEPETAASRPSGRGIPTERFESALGSQTRRLTSKQAQDHSGCGALRLLSWGPEGRRQGAGRGRESEKHGWTARLCAGSADSQPAGE